MSTAVRTKLPPTDGRVAKARWVAGFDNYPVDKQILGLYALGYNETQISQILGIKWPAIRSKMRRSKIPSGATTIAELVYWAIDTGVILPLPMKGSLGELNNMDRHIVDLVARGFTNRQIAREIHMSLDGVRTRMERILDRAGALSRTNLVALWASQEYYDEAHFLTRQNRRAEWDALFDPA